MNHEVYTPAEVPKSAEERVKEKIEMWRERPFRVSPGLEERGQEMGLHDIAAVLAGVKPAALCEATERMPAEVAEQFEILKKMVLAEGLSVKQTKDGRWILGQEERVDWIEKSEKGMILPIGSESQIPLGAFDFVHGTSLGYSLPDVAAFVAKIYQLHRAKWELDLPVAEANESANQEYARVREEMIAHCEKEGILTKDFETAKNWGEYYFRSVDEAASEYDSLHQEQKS